MSLLEQAKDKFSKWRDSRSKTNEKIPEELLELACQCAFKCGKSVVVKELGIGPYRLADAMIVYPESSFQEIQQKSVEEPAKEKERQIESDVEFHEVLIKKTAPMVERAEEARQEKTLGANSSKDKIFLNDQETKNEIVFEIESKLGFRIKVFSDSESMHRNLISCFLDVGY